MDEINKKLEDTSDKMDEIVGDNHGN